MNLTQVKRFLPYFLLALYAAISVYFFQNWEFTTDDANVIKKVASLANGPFWLGTRSSLGAFYPPFLFYLYGLFYFLAPGVRAIQFCILFFQLLGHYFIFAIGREFKRPMLGIGASLLYFFAPGFLLFYNQKFWEISLLPAFSAFAFWALLRFSASPKSKYLYASLVGCILSAGSHLGAVLYFPLLVFTVFVVIKEKRIKLKVRDGVLISVGILFGCSTLLAWLIGGGIEPDLFQFAPGKFLNPVEPLLYLLSAFNNYIPARIGMGIEIWPRFLRYVPEVVFLFCFLFICLVRFKRTGLQEKILFLWIVGLLGLCCASAVFLPRFPFQWTLIFFPFIWFAVLLPVFYLPRLATYIALVAVLLANVGNSLRYEGYLSRSGGIAWHLATISTKEAVFDAIYRESENPIVYLAVSRAKPLWWYDSVGWSFLANVYRSKANVNESAEPSVFFIYQEEGIASDPEIRRKLELLPGVHTERIGSVTLFRSKEGKVALGMPLF